MLFFQPPTEVQFPCPNTKRPLSIAMRTDADSLAKLWGANIDVECPHCGVTHQFNVRDSYLDYTLKTESHFAAPPKGVSRKAR